MDTATTLGADGADALDILESVMAALAATDPTQLADEEKARRLRALERIDAIEAAVRGRLLAAFDAQNCSVADGQRTTRAWIVHVTGVTKGQAAEHTAVQKLAERHPVLADALAEGHVLAKSEALQLAKWIRRIPEQYRAEAEEILVAAARAGADLRALAAICGEILSRTAPPDPDDDPALDRAVSFDTTMDGAGVLRGDLTPQCAAMVQAVLDALSAPQGGGDLRTRPQRYHDALEEAMRRLLASGLLPQRAGQPVKALVHVTFADLCAMDRDSALQEQWITAYRARWAAHRAAASVATGDGGAWLDGDQARTAACDAMLIPVVTGDLDPGAVEDLIILCVTYHRLRTQHPTPDPAQDPTQDPAAQEPASEGPSGHDPAQDPPSEGPGTEDFASPGAPLAPDLARLLDPDGPGVPPGLLGRAARQARQTQQTAVVTQALDDLEHQIIAKILQVVSGPGGVASFLRRTLLGKGLNGPSLPLDVGQTDDIPIHLRRLVALRDQTCQHPGGCDQPASGCEAHHVVHRKDGGSTSLINLKDYCWWHHHVLLHELGWILEAHPDGTSRVTSPDGRTIHSHAPPPRPD